MPAFSLIASGQVKVPVIATAGWSIPKTVAHRFPETGSGLSRYAAVFNGVEINSTFIATTGRLRSSVGQTRCPMISALP